VQIGRNRKHVEVTDISTSIKTDEKTTVFLDTNVVISYLMNRGAAAQIFDERISSHTRYVINPIVMQELLLIGDSTLRSKVASMIDDNHIAIADLRPDLSEVYINKARQLRNRLIHTNDLLILSSASQCDYFVTDDMGYQRLVQDERPNIITAEKFVSKSLKSP